MSEEADLCGDVPPMMEFGEFYTRYRGRVLRFVRKIAHTNDLAESRLDAEGVVQEAFEQAWRTWDKIEHPERWIFRVAARIVQKLARAEWAEQQRLRQRCPLRLNFSVADTDPVHTSVVAKQAMNRILTLPTNQRIATYLHHVEGWKGSEIAALLEISPGTVASHIHRGTARTKDALLDERYPVRRAWADSDDLRDSGRDLFSWEIDRPLPVWVRSIPVAILVGLVLAVVYGPTLLAWIAGLILGTVILGPVLLVAGLRGQQPGSWGGLRDRPSHELGNGALGRLPGVYGFSLSGREAGTLTALVSAITGMTGRSWMTVSVGRTDSSVPRRKLGIDCRPNGNHDRASDPQRAR
ncbi:RNA polymerase sigma factor [Nocardia sp. NPDC005825]|uniref:RNA polymerase sigma factor n=1 Tax=unclassified Nocardia TaxID=2637762 RepID=UPI0033F3B065